MSAFGSKAYITGWLFDVGSKKIIRLPSSVSLRDVRSITVALDPCDEVRLVHFRYAQRQLPDSKQSAAAC